MPARANTRSIRHIMKGEPSKTLNILTFTTHERYEETLCKTGHNFYALRAGKEWDETYAPVPDNYHIVDSIPDYVDIDLVLSHTSDNRIQIAHDILTSTRGKSGQLACPILMHCHVLPDVRFDVDEQTSLFQAIPVDHNSFISHFNRNQWGFSDENSSVIPHGIDVDFWTTLDGMGSNKKWSHLGCISAVNEFPSRDWCCGFELWKDIASSVKCKVVGKCTGTHAGFSTPATSKNQLREFYKQHPLYLNTSLHSPVPTALMEAMACGTAVVSTETCMIPEIIEHGVNGFMSNDPNELKKYCELLINDEELAISMGHAAQQTIKSKFGIDRFVKGWDDLFYTTIGDFKI
jgi:glycosyltransferase involved in cell wall biosynthesis